MFETYGTRRKMVMGSRNVARQEDHERTGETGIGQFGWKHCKWRLLCFSENGFKELAVIVILYILYSNSMGK
jgi:hypothetical protein